MSPQEVRVVVADGFVHEDPAMLAILLLEKPVVAERRNCSMWKNPLVDRALDQGGLLPAAFGDHGGARPTGDVEAVDLVLPLPDSQRSNLQRRRVRIELVPGLSGRMAHHVRWSPAHGGR